MDFFGPRSDDSQSSAGDVAEANVEAGKVSSPDKENAEGHRGPVFVVQVGRVNPEGQPIPFVKEDVRATNSQYGVQHGLDGDSCVLEIDPIHHLTHIGQSHCEIGLREWVVRIKAGEQQIGDLLTELDVLAGPSSQTNPAVRPAVDLDQFLVG